MKKKIGIGIGLALIAALGVGYVYLDSILTSIVLSTLDGQYGLRLEMEDLEIGATPGWVTIQKPDIYDSKSSSSQKLFHADSLQLGLNLSHILSGQVDLAELRSFAPAVYLVENDQQALNWSAVIPRFLPAQTVARDNAAPPADTASFQTPIPPAVLDDFQIHYTGQDSNSYTIAFGKLNHDPSKHHLSIKNLSATRNQEKMASIASAEVKNLFNEARSSLIDVDISGIQLLTQELSPGQYNSSEVMNAWLRVYDEIAALVPAAQQSDAADDALPLGTLVLSNVDIQALPVNGTVQNQGAVQVRFERMQYDVPSGEILISKLETQEAGHPALTVETLSMQYDLNSGSLGAVNLSGVRVDVREGAQGDFNLNRAVERVQSLLESLLPKETEQTAQAQPSENEIIGDLNMTDALLTFYRQEGGAHSIGFEEFTYTAASRELQLSALQIKKDVADAAGLVSIPTVKAVTGKEKPFTQWDSLTVENMKASLQMNEQGLDLSALMADWSALGSSFSSDADEGSSSADTAVPFQTIHIAQADIQYTDLRNPSPLTHHFSPIQIHWNQAGKPPADLKIDGEIQSPGKGTFEFEGRCSPVLSPLTVAGKPVITLQNLTPYEPLYQPQMPVKIDESGFRLEGDLKITDNQLDSSFDLYLLQPQFSVATGNLPIKFDGHAVVKTLNGLKDQKGVIAFKNNKVTGDITDPQFSFGTGIGNVLTQLILNRGLDVINLPKDLAKEGLDAVKNIPGTAGKVLDGILNFGNR